MAVESAIEAGAPGTPARRQWGLRLLTAGYALGVPGTLASPWIMKRRSVPAFAALLAGSGMITIGWGLLLPGRRAKGAFPVNGLGFLGFVAWWRAAGRR